MQMGEAGEGGGADGAGPMGWGQWGGASEGMRPYVCKSRGLMLASGGPCRSRSCSSGSCGPLCYAGSRCRRPHCVGPRSATPSWRSGRLPRARCTYTLGGSVGGSVNHALRTYSQCAQSMIYMQPNYFDSSYI